MSSSRHCLSAWQIDVQPLAADGLLLFLWGLAYAAGAYAIFCTGWMPGIKWPAVVVMSILFVRAWRRRLRMRGLRMTPAVLQLDLQDGWVVLLPPWSAIVTPWFVLLDVPVGESRAGQILFVKPGMAPEQWRVFCTLLKLKGRQKS